MRFVFTGQQQSLSSILTGNQGAAQSLVLCSGFSATVFFPRCAQGAAVGEMGVQSEAAQSISGNTARAASFLFTCCSSVSRVTLCICGEKVWQKTLQWSNKGICKRQKIQSSYWQPCTPCAAQRARLAQLVLGDFSHTRRFKCSLSRCLLFGESPPKRWPTA